jgi:hypothetical protein
MKSEGSFSCSKELTTETAGKICYTSSNPLVFRPILVLVLFSHFFQPVLSIQVTINVISYLYFACPTHLILL